MTVNRGVAMDDRLDDELRALRSEPLPAGYQRLEARVWQGIERVRQARAAAPTLLAVRAAAVVGALGLGVASGGATAVAVAAQSQEVSAFSAKAELAPSTLLDHHG
jgi:hypothetical protein